MAKKTKVKKAKRGGPISSADAHDRAEKAREAAEPEEECGCRAGIGIFNDNHEIQRCDDCDLFEGDDDAAAAVEHLLELLHKEYRQHSREDESTVADAFDRLVFLQKHGRRPGPGEA